MKVHQFMHEMSGTSATFGRKSDISVVFKGDQAATDGSTIILPSLPMNKDLTHEQVLAMRGFVDHEAGHIRHSDMPRIMDFYSRCVNNGKEDLKNIHNALEDIWMEQKVQDEYPGSFKNLKQADVLVRSREYGEFGPAVEAGEYDPKAITATNICLAITTSKKGFNGEGSYSSKLRALLGDNLVEFSDKWYEQALACENSEDVITLAKSVYKLLKEDPNLSSSPEDFDPTSGEGAEEGEPMPEGKGEKEVKSAIGDALTSGNVHGEEMGEPAGGVGDMVGDFEDSSYRVSTTEYDREFKRGVDVDTPGYTGYELVRIVNTGEHTEYDNIKAGLRSDIMTMKNKLKRALLARQQRDWDFGRETGRLDTKRLVGAYRGSQTVFKQRIDRQEEDTAITLLVDLSGSMVGEPSTVARDCAVALSECLDGSNLKFRVTGFRNSRKIPSCEGKFHRYRPLDIVTFKDYNMSLRQTRGSIAMIPHAVGGDNSDYDFLVHEFGVLKARPEKRKVLIVLSDGYPASYSMASRGEIIKHCKIAVKEAQRDSIECVGIGIQSPAVSEIYQDYVVVDNISELSGTMFNKLTGLLLKGQ